ncbi:hypothetical protein Hanom_Chr02g00099501 [Helianthus anomalus]
MAGGSRVPAAVPVTSIGRFWRRNSLSDLGGDRFITKHAFLFGTPTSTTPTKTLTSMFNFILHASSSCSDCNYTIKRDRSEIRETTMIGDDVDDDGDG